MMLSSKQVQKQVQSYHWWFYTLLFSPFHGFTQPYHLWPCFCILADECIIVDKTNYQIYRQQPVVRFYFIYGNFFATKTEIVQHKIRGKCLGWNLNQQLNRFTQKRIIWTFLADRLFFSVWELNPFYKIQINFAWIHYLWLFKFEWIHSVVFWL